MRRRRWRLLALGVVVTLVGGTGLEWLVARGPTITWASYARIDRGMTVDDISVIIGAPPGEYGAPGPCQELSGDSQRYVADLPEDCRYVTWVGPVTTIGVYLDKADRVIAKDIAEDPRRWWERLAGFGEVAPASP